MSSITNPGRRLVADIGGTNSRLALFDPISNELESLRTYVNRDYERLEDIIAEWLHSLSVPEPTECCLAVAAPPFGDRVTMLNIDWSFSIREVTQRFGFTRMHCINDFEGNAYALPHLATGDLTLLHSGKEKDERHKLATIGPGTGLGGATLTLGMGMPIACASEPGHMSLAAATELELELFRYLQPRYGDVYAELLVSGPGLQRLYESLADIQNQDAPPLTPAEISAQALSGENELCKLALNTFSGLLGSISGDYVLANGAYDGLYLAGGFIPGMIPFLEESTFISRFQEKGNMRNHLSEVPLFVITSAVTGLIGAAHASL